MDNRAEVREFLITRRGRITPDEAGIQTYGTRRRVTGLRREEVARLAGMSIDYYTRLERGNLTGVSEEVLTAIARALQLDDAERDHLFNLAKAAGPARRTRPTPQHSDAVRPELRYLLDAITDAPALIANNYMDILAANTLGYAMHSPLYAGPERPANHSRFMFLDPRAHDFYPDWQLATEMNVAVLRRIAGANPHDQRLAKLVGELSMRSDRFRDLWASHNVRNHYTGTKSFRHPVVGLLDVNYVALALDGDPGLTLTTYTATPGSPTADALKLLATWAATENITQRVLDPHATAPGAGR
ncbi:MULTISPECIES: helix-turn-helix transcriptional regulator [Tessaracoccus]|uniref:helix-turn-helix transcriptional regulator n=1 Tax=Tessaracoccus TaxID=72763 RepID=UPI00099D54D7|nr:MULTISPECIES: helix-turn-helix transcriptional regulator [Tessaracoccus]AQX16963.1 transcriptional regulator [Tessaracoccus sp. T2.5-30]VEP41800.1 hypothetical protein TLA_TLA_02887 [Tessaracoccus lapidicaptus]